MALSTRPNSEHYHFAHSHSCGASLMRYYLINSGMISIYHLYHDTLFCDSANVPIVAANQRNMCTATDPKAVHLFRIIALCRQHIHLLTYHAEWEQRLKYTGTILCLLIIVEWSPMLILKYSWLLVWLHSQQPALHIHPMHATQQSHKDRGPGTWCHAHSPSPHDEWTCQQVPWIQLLCFFKCQMKV